MRSVHRIQRAMVRMLFDPAFVDRVYAGAVDELNDAERALLVDVDRRAWSTDRYRRSRGVHALIEEYPCTTAVLGIPEVDAFFSSAAFARVLSDRGSLALDFGGWAADRARGVARLERAIATARRGERPDGSGIVTRPGLEPIAVDRSDLTLFSELRQRLGPDPVARFAEGFAVVQLPARTELEFLLVERDASGGIGIGGGSASLIALLSFTLEPHERAAVQAEAVKLGCSEDEAAELVDDLIEEGLLVAR